MLTIFILMDIVEKNFKLVGVPGIEPESHAPEACILPLYYTPNIIFNF